jgi:hypothetical protein
MSINLTPFANSIGLLNTQLSLAGMNKLPVPTNMKMPSDNCKMSDTMWTCNRDKIPNINSTAVEK